MPKQLFITLIALIMFIRFAIAQNFDIHQFGANGDGKTSSTKAIQQALDACVKSGGGKVIISQGTYFTGTLFLKSNTHLYLEAGAILKGSPDLSDYTPYNEVHLGMIYCENAENVTIDGPGNIDGNGDLFVDLTKAKKIEWGGTKYTRQKDKFRMVADGGVGDGPVVPKARPYQMFIFSNCKKITVKDILVTNPPFWTMHFADCDGVLVEGIRLWTNMLIPNADGIDVTSCSNVIISNCDIRAGDDAVAIVGYDHHFEIPGFHLLRHPSENITVTNCHLQSYSSGVRMGYLDQNPVRNIIVSNCTITNSTRGIGIFLRDQASLENILISNIFIETKLRTGDWWGNGEPIHISAVRGKDSVQLGQIKNVRFENITCRAENGILIYGSEESRIEGVSFHNISLELVDSKLNEVAGGNIDLRGCALPKPLFERDLPGLLATYVNDLTIDGFKLKWTNTRMKFFTHGIEANHFNGLHIREFTGKGSPVNPASFPIFLENGMNAEIDKSSGLKKINVR